MMHVCSVSDNHQYGPDKWELFRVTE